MRKLCVWLLLVSAAPAHAEEAAGYPRTISRDGETCVQQLNVNGVVVERCRREGEAWSQEIPAAVPAPPDQPEPRPERPARAPGPTAGAGPVVEGRRHAVLDVETESWLAGGVVSGCLLGLVGCGVVALVANNSESEPPREYDYEGNDRAAYRRAYTAQLQTERTEDAVIGGLVGTAIVVVGVVIAVNVVR